MFYPNQLLTNSCSQFDPESLHMCTKLSGEAVQFSRREKFDSIVRHLTARWTLYWVPIVQILPFRLIVVTQQFSECSSSQIVKQANLICLLHFPPQGAHEDARVCRQDQRQWRNVPQGIPKLQKRDSILMFFLKYGCNYYIMTFFRPGLQMTTIE